MVASLRELEKQRQNTASDILQKKQEAEAAVSVPCCYTEHRARANLHTLLARPTEARAMTPDRRQGLYLTDNLILS